MSRQAKRARAKEKRRERLAQVKADNEVREDWLAAVHGERKDLQLLARTDGVGERGRASVLREDEVPAGVTHAMLRAACLRALGSM